MNIITSTWLRFRAACLSSNLAGQGRRASAVSAAVPILALLFGLTPIVAVAQNPYNINGMIPDADTTEYVDPNGSTKELSAINSNATKIGVIHTALVPMLGYTNQNSQVDLNMVWIDSRIATDGDVWLYFAWARDSNRGSGFIALEAQQAPEPAGCDYSGSEANLIASCNPWSGRAAEDFMILWDQQGGNLDIYLRVFDGTVWGPPLLLDSSVAEAAYGSDNYRGELALNLTETVFTPGECTSIANMLPSTVTGNSDTADYKDTVFFDAPTISNCGTVIIRKQTDPNGLEGTFSFGNDLFVENGNGGTEYGSFNLADDGVQTIQNVFQTGQTDPETPSLYYVAETTLAAGFDLSEIDCSASDVADNVTVFLLDKKVTFTLGPDETVDCTFTNQARAQLIVVKNTTGGYNGTFGFTSTTLSSFSLTTLDGTASTTISGLAPGTYDVAETVPAGWNLVSAACSSGDLPGAISLAAGESETCTFTNAPERGAIKITKTRKFASATSGNPLSQPHPGVTFTVSGGSLSADQTVTTAANGEACVDNLVLSSFVEAYTVAETVPSGYAADGDDGDGVFSKTVSVVAEGTCTTGTQAAVSFSNTPLTNISVSASAQDPGATKSQIVCSEGSSSANTDPVSLNVTGLLPGTYTCTITIDP
jgi:hypothetical protein